jgi:hypothetical protein
MSSQERVDIDNRIEGERLAEERRAEESRRISAFRVAEHGQALYFTTDAGYEFLDAAKRLRIYLTKEPSAPMDNLPGCLPHRVEITADQFNELSESAWRTPGKYPVCSISILTSGSSPPSTLWTVGRPSPWTTCPQRSITHPNTVLTDKYSSGIVSGTAERKEITSASHLSVRNISFSEEITEMDDCLNFYLNADFDVDAVFGTEVCTSANDDAQCLRQFTIWRRTRFTIRWTSSCTTATAARRR